MAVSIRQVTQQRRAAIVKRLLPALACVAVAATGAAQAPAGPAPQQNAYAYALPVDRGASGLAQTLRKLHTRASLIQINAHPDDEDGGMLTYQSRAVGADVSLLSLNRGEGGQNVMTGDFWDALGILRTQEHLAANRYYGDHLYYTRVADFGFSKTLEEALTQWGHDRVLADVVRVVRATRPMVVTSVFAGYVSDGHGHHQTAGVMAQEVFKAAADPKMFPEQLKEGLRPWAPLKVYARVPFARVTEKGIFDYATGKWEPVVFKNYVTGEVLHSVPSATVVVPEGTYNPLFGESYFQLAREGLNEQKSQNGGTGYPSAGRFDAPYHLYASRLNGTLPQHEDGFFQGIDTTVPAIADYLKGNDAGDTRTKLQSIAAQVDAATAAYDANHPAKSAPALAEGLKLTRSLIAQIGSGSVDDPHYNVLHELRLKQQQFQLALNQALGMTLLAIVQPQGASAGRIGPFGPTDAASAAAGSSAASTTVIAGQPFAVSVHVADQGTQPVQVNSVKLVADTAGEWKFTDQSAPLQALAAGEGADVALSATVPQNAPLTGPYFSRPNLEQSYYDLQNPLDLTMPDMPYPLSAEMTYTYAGVPLTLRGVVQTARRENGYGVVVNPLLIAPAISVLVSPRAGVMPLSATTFPLDVTLHSSVKGPAEGQVTLKLPTGWTSQPESAPFHLLRDNEDTNLHFDVTPKGVRPTQYNIAAVATYAGKQYSQGFTSIGYPGIRPYPQYAPAVYKATGVDVKTAPNLRVAYIMGTGDDVPRSLQNLGIRVTQLTASDVAAADLNAYDAIVLGIRTYAARPELRTFNNRLLEYVRKGGVVVTEYQTPEYDRNYGPYPLSVPGDAEKVVEETAKVTLLKPEDPAFTWPNRIVPADFDGWVEERGHGFLRSFDSRYTALTEVHDAGQDPQTGGLVYARYGKGYYVYLAFAFFRQMPEGVPGSYRIMANLLSLGKNPNLPHE